jgi:DNA-binding CsgD family transcriptional regulator
MDFSLQISSAKKMTVYELWDGLADFQAIDGEHMLAHFFTQLAKMIHADNAMWFGIFRLLNGEAAQQDPVFGWRSPVIRQWKPDPVFDALVQRFIADQKNPAEVKLGITSTKIMQSAGQHRAHLLLNGWIDLEAFKKTSHYEIYYRQGKVVDRMWLGFPLNDDTESIFTFDRLGQSSAFTEEDLALAAYAVRGLKWFHRRLLMLHGILAAGEVLSPAERKIMPQLLTEQTEKEIATKLSLSFDGVHKHVKSIYKKCSVRNRSGLLMMWAGG